MLTVCARWSSRDADREGLEDSASGQDDMQLEVRATQRAGWPSVEKHCVCDCHYHLMLTIRLCSSLQLGGIKRYAVV